MYAMNFKMKHRYFLTVYDGSLRDRRLVDKPSVKFHENKNIHIQDVYIASIRADKSAHCNLAL